MKTELTRIAERLGALYQMVGQINGPKPISDEKHIAALDEILSITEDVEKLADEDAP